MQFRTAALVAVLGLASQVRAHGRVLQYQIKGKTYNMWNWLHTENYDETPTAGWIMRGVNYPGGVLGAQYQGPDIICDVNALPGQMSTTLAAGDDITFMWEPTFDRSHHGPVLTYMADCHGDCTTVDKSKLMWFKIQEAGLLRPQDNPGPFPTAQGYWATDQLKDNDNSWTVTIPRTIKRGKYVVRHERIGLHMATGRGLAQHYPDCLNVEITGDGTDQPKGTAPGDLYHQDDPGLQIAIYVPHESYTIPGPPLYQPGSTGRQQSGAGPGASTAAPLPMVDAGPMSPSPSTPAPISSTSSAESSTGTATDVSTSPAPLSSDPSPDQPQPQPASPADQSVPEPSPPLADTSSLGSTGGSGTATDVPTSPTTVASASSATSPDQSSPQPGSPVDQLAPEPIPPADTSSSVSTGAFSGSSGPTAPTSTGSPGPSPKPGPYRYQHHVKECWGPHGPNQNGLHSRNFAVSRHSKRYRNLCANHHH